MGKKGSFDYDEIGGTNSYIRRLSLELSDYNNIEILYVIYGSERSFIKKHYNKITSIYVEDIECAFNILSDCDEIFIVYLPLFYMYKFKKYLWSLKIKPRVHMFFWSYPESLYIRWLIYITSFLLRQDGYVIAVSKRLYDDLIKLFNKVIYLIPPVPKSFFIEPSIKNIDEGNLIITYIGRMDINKGILETIKIMENLHAYCNKIRFTLLGFYSDFYYKDTSIDAYISNLDFINYILQDNKYSKKGELDLIKILHETDIFLQPYRYLSSTMDTPLLLLENMAALNPYITHPYGDIPLIYPSKVCLIDNDIIIKSLELIKTYQNWLASERCLIRKRNFILNYESKYVAECFYNKIILG